MKTKLTKTVLLICSFFLGINLNAQSDGEALFKANCGTCHYKTDKRSVGPGLKGISERRKEDWIINWVKDSPKLIASGDADAQSIFNEFNKQSMPTFAQLSDDDIKAVVAYIEKQEEVAPAVASTAAKEVVEKEKEEEFPGYVYWLIILALLAIIYAKLKGMSFKSTLNANGYSINEDKLQFRDVLSQFYKSNSNWIFILILCILALVVRSCIGELNP